VLAIVPVKSLSDAKTRLATALAPAERERLVVRMLDAVLAACSGAESIRGVLVVTPDPGLGRGFPVLRDSGRGHGPALATALADPRARDGAVVVMADCPFVTASSLDALVAAADPLALVEAADGGTSALALRDPLLLEPAFGVPGSAAVTVARARAVGIQPVLVDDPSLAFDVDRPGDLDRVFAA
jgi:2-phospho-L-lactate/phosphoenolpyruvate guanylyltransferase